MKRTEADDFSPTDAEFEAWRHVHETDHFAAYAEREQDWLKRYVRAGTFSHSFLPALQGVHHQILHDPMTYLREVSRFKYQTGARIPGPIIYVARLVVSRPEPGVGFNIVFSPSDPSHQEVGTELYPRTLERLGLSEHTLPFGVLWADAYYYQGSAYLHGNLEGKVEESGHEVFHDWETTWAALHHPEAAVFFRLSQHY